MYFLACVCMRFVYATVEVRLFFIAMEYGAQLKHPKWQEKRLRILDRDKWACVFCGNKEDVLHVHHKEYGKGKKAWEYDNDNFTSLCEHCHDIVEWLRKHEEEVISTYLLSNKEGKKTHLLSYTKNGFCFIWEFREGGEVKGKELLIALPFKIIEDFYNFFKSNIANG